MDDLVSDFIAETREGLESLDSELVRFEQRPDDPETLGGIFRLVHTIKGTCGFLGLGRLQTVAHAAENVLGGFRDGVLAVTPEAVSAVLDTVDLIRALIDGLASTGVEPEGDDRNLIRRLEAVVEACGEGASAAVAMVTTPAARSLLDRLGGDATLDAAVEMAIPRLRGDALVGPKIASVDADQLQGALRGALSELARKESPTGALHREASLCEGRADLLAAVFDSVAAALSELDIEPSAIVALRGLALDPTGQNELGVDLLGEPVAPASSAQAQVTAEVETQPSARSNAGPGESGGAVQTIRVSVDALENLMTVVSELVLIRNQLIQTLRLEPECAFAAPLNRLNQVTSELQEGVMTTRMQPISGAWAKLPRQVRDLAQELGKRIELTMSGQETELDRQVMELIKDPLTHMIRNAADHGLETPEERRAAGKAETGRISLQARHEGGAIVIEVSDDGRGLAAEKIRAKALSTGLVTVAQAEQMGDAETRQLIFLPGFSTASQVTNVSGRGVGMDVVRTNIEKIGGSIEVSSVDGGGSRFIIRIPLTLTIVSALIVECCGEHFAPPQSSVVELVSASGASGRAIEHINDTAVLRLRDRLLPLVSLQQLLQLEPNEEPSGETCIVVAQVGAFTFGVIVDRVFDTEEIVVKPVATVLRHLKLYSGATILGDGSVILILDPKGISAEAGEGQGAYGRSEAVEGAAQGQLVEAHQTLLVFRVADEVLKAAPLDTVSRIEEVEPHQIERVDGRVVIQYRGRLMPILGVDARPAPLWDGPGRRPLLVFTRNDRVVGLLVDEIVDIVDSATSSDLTGHKKGALGSLIVAGRATELIDVNYYWRCALNDDASPPSDRRLLIIEPSAYTRELLAPMLARAGYEAVIVSDAHAAMARYREGEQFSLILADTKPGNQGDDDLAGVLAQARGWHATPLLSLDLATEGAAGIDGGSILAAVDDALRPARGAA